MKKAGTYPMSQTIKSGGGEWTKPYYLAQTGYFRSTMPGTLIVDGSETEIYPKLDSVQYLALKK